MEYRRLPEVRTGRFRLRRIVPAETGAVFRGRSDPAVVSRHPMIHARLAA